MQDNDNNNTHYRYNNKDLWYRYPDYLISLRSSNDQGNTMMTEMSNKTIYAIQTLSDTWYQGYGTKSGYQPIFYFREKVM